MEHIALALARCIELLKGENPEPIPADDFADTLPAYRMETESE